MLGQKREEDVYEDSELGDDMLDKAYTIYSEEMKINPEEKVYLITWSPNPKETPDCEFESQHEFLVHTVIEYLRCCSAGLFCVETTQLGEPHYHGWYQIDPTRERGRIIMVKIMQRYGNVKIAKMMAYRVHSYKEHANGLHYYKKDVFDSMAHVKLNPVSALTPVPDIPLSEFSYFMRMDGRKTLRQIEEKVSSYKYYKEFYSQKIKPNV